MTAIVEQVTRRIRITADGDGLDVRIASRQPDFSTLFLVVWMVGWTISLFQGFPSVPDVDLTGALLGVPIFLLGWLVPCGPATLEVLWRLAGSERITISGDRLRIERRMPFLARSSAHDLEGVANLVSLHCNRRRRPLTLRGFLGAFLTWLDPGTIAFDDGPRIVAFGVELNEAEAQLVVDRLGPRLRPP